MQHDPVLSALANPVRRRLLERLLEAPCAAGTLAEGFEIGRPAVSEHLGVLRKAGLVREEKQGRQRIYALCPEPLAELRSWLAPYEDYWRAQLTRLARDLEETEE